VVVVETAQGNVSGGMDGNDDVGGEDSACQGESCNGDNDDMRSGGGGIDNLTEEKDKAALS
jgi:hypothetical protein